MHRFFIPIENFSDTKVLIPENLAHQILHVLRMKSADQILVLDNAGYQYLVSLENEFVKPLYARILSKKRAEGELNRDFHLFFSFAERSKFEWILQKGTELGVKSFHPYISSRTQIADKKVTTSKIQRWKAIIREAAEQSERGLIPELCSVAPFQDAVRFAHQHLDLNILAWEEAHPDQKIDDVTLIPEKDKSISLFIGPKGGFSQEEVDFASTHKLRIVSLGKRILKVDTAVIVAITVLLNRLGEL